MDWESRLSKWADSMEEKAGKISDWGSAEVPEYIRELIQWEIVSNLLLSGILLALVVGSAFAIRALCYRVVFNKELDDEIRLTIGLFVGIPFLAVLVVACFHSYWAAERSIKAYVAPRVVVVEKITALVGVKAPSK